MQNREAIISMRIGLVSLMKDEGPHLDEWLNFHRAVGITDFWIFDHESRDDTQEILQRWQNKGVRSSTVIWNGGGPLALQCWDVAAAWITDLDWVGGLDGDELAVPLSAWTMGEVLAGLPPSCDGVAFHWKHFGERESPSASLLAITQASTHEFARNRAFKSFARTAAVKGQRYYSTHQPPITASRMLRDCSLPMPSGLFTGNPSFVHAQINHYKWRSEAEYARIRQRGMRTRHGATHDAAKPSVTQWRKWTNAVRDFRAQEVATHHDVSWS